MPVTRSAHGGSPIAIVGMHCRLPGANGVEQFWSNLINGVDAVEPLENAAPDKVSVRRAFDGVDEFDAEFFGMTRREAEITDPHVRTFLEAAWHVFESAGYEPSTYPGAIGVYAGMSASVHAHSILADLPLAEAVGAETIDILNNPAALSTLTSYKLDLKGPSVTLSTTCSTSLVAVHFARQALLSGDCDMALVGAVSIPQSALEGYCYHAGGILSPDGRCRPFGADSQGTAPGSGVCVVLLKRLADAVADGDAIRAVLRGSAVNNDGRQKVGYTAPSISGQAEVIAKAMAVAGVRPEDVTYVEAHGTGTALGDPIELAGLTRGFGPRASDTPCLIGSVKSNIGHLDAAAGLAGLIKVALALERGQIPPTLHCDVPNPALQIDHTRFRINDRLAVWNAPRPKRAGVSSFGIGGTNAHVVLEEAPTPPTRPSTAGPQLLVWSARSSEALTSSSDALGRHLQQTCDQLEDIAYTLQLGRRHFSHRRFIVCDDGREAAAQLLGEVRQGRLEAVAPDGRAPLIFVFPGQGTQSVDMGVELYRTQPSFQSVVDRCCELLQPVIGSDLREVLYPRHETRERASALLRQTKFAQPALFVVEYALAAMWLDSGLVPDAMVGHSLGELVAACVSGVFSEADALRIVATRGSLMQQLAPGSMLAVNCSEADLLRTLPDSIAIVAVNGPRQCVVGGDTAEIDRLAKRLEGESILVRRLEVDRAFHTAAVDPALDGLRRAVRAARLGEPRWRFISNVTGQWMTADEATDPEYWVRHARSTVQFASGIRCAAEALAGAAWLEVGPGTTLTGAIRQNLPACRTVLSGLGASDRGTSPAAMHLQTLGRLWLAGVTIDWPKLHAGQRPRRVRLPVYPFERQRYRRRLQDAIADRRDDRGIEQSASVGDWLYVPAWREAARPAQLATTAKPQQWMIFSDGSPLASALAGRDAAWRDRFVTVNAADRFSTAERSYAVRPRHQEDYRRLMADVHARGGLPERILYMWPAPRVDASGPMDASHTDGFCGLLFLVKALTATSIGHAAEIVIVSEGVHLIAGGERGAPAQAATRALLQVIQQEYPHLRCRSIDVASTNDTGADLAHVMAELSYATDDSAVAYRGGRRWVPTTERLRLARRSARAARVREHGVYLITGGLGRVGFHIARYLIESARARVALVGRTPLPVGDAAAEWLATHEASDPVATKLRRLEILRQGSGGVLALSADVANFGQMRAAVAEVKDRFGALNGIVHAAGRVDSSAFTPISQTDRSACEAHFGPKVAGVHVLDEIMGEEGCDWCVLVSSLSAVLGGLGFGAYASANAYMDAFAEAPARCDRWTSVNWDGWRFDESARPGVRQADALAMSPADGIEAFHRIMDTDRPVARVIVSTADLDARRKCSLGTGGADARAALQAATASMSSQPSRVTWAASEEEHAICAVWEQVLGQPPADPEDDFFDLGGNSLVAIQVIAQLRRRFRCDFPVDVIFSDSGAARLAMQIAEMRRGAAGASTCADSVCRDVLEGTAASSPEAGSGASRSPASFAQRRLWVAARLAPGSCEYNLVEAVRLHGPLDVRAFGHAIDEIVRRHAVLRGRYALIDGTLVQEIDPPPLDVVTIEALGGRSPETARAAVLREWNRPFDLASGPLVRFCLFRCAADEHLFVRAAHHIVWDAASESIFNRELLALYRAHRLGEPGPQPPLTAQYGDFARWELEQTTAAGFDRGLDYWVRTLAGAPECLTLPRERSRDAERYEADVWEVDVSAEDVAALKRFSRSRQSTLFMTLLSAFAVVLARHSGQDDIVIGSPVSSRSRGGFETQIGFFVNMLPLRVRVRRADGFDDLLRQVRRTTLDAYEHQEVPFDRVVAALAPPRLAHTPPVFQAVLDFQNVPTAPLALSGLRVEPEASQAMRVHVDVELHIWEVTGRLRIGWRYNRALFGQAQVAHMARHLTELLTHLVDADTTRGERTDDWAAHA